MAISAGTTNGAPTITGTPAEAGGQFVDDLAAFHALTKNGIRYAENFAGADIGAKVNAAVADLPNGGNIWLPAGDHSFSTPIVMETSRIHLKAIGSYDRHAPTGATTHLTYTGGSGSAITIGDGVSRVQGVLLEGFLLDFPAIAGPAVDIKALATYGRFRDVKIEGTGQTGTGILTGDSGVHAWRADGLYVHDFDIGLDINNHHWSNYIGCVFNGNNTGVRIGESNTPSGLSFVGCDFEGNDLAALEIVDVEVLSVFGGYSELTGDASTQWMLVGTGAEAPVNVTVIGHRVQSNASAVNALEVSRVKGLAVRDCLFTALSGHVVKNNATSVSRIQLTGNVYGENGTAGLIDDTTGVTLMDLRDGNTLYPNLPDGDPGVSGALYRVSGSNNELRWSP